MTIIIENSQDVEKNSQIHLIFFFFCQDNNAKRHLITNKQKTISPARLFLDFILYFIHRKKKIIEYNWKKREKGIGVSK